MLLFIIQYRPRVSDVGWMRLQDFDGELRSNDSFSLAATPTTSDPRTSDL